MTGLVLRHFMNSVVNGVQSQLLGFLCDGHLACASAFLSKHALFHVGLGVPYHLAQQFGESRCVVGLFESVTLECFCDFGITLAVRLASHSQIHTYLTAFTIEVIVKTLENELVGAFLCDSNYVFCHEVQTFVLFYFLELVAWNFALWTSLRGSVALVYIPANRAYPFLCHNFCLL